MEKSEAYTLGAKQHRLNIRKGGLLSSVSLADLGWDLTVLFLAVGFFTPIGFSAQAFCVWFALLAVCALAQIKSGLAKLISPGQWLCLGALSLITLLLAALNEYGGGYAAKVLLSVFGLHLLVGVLGDRTPRHAESIFYFVFTCAISLTLITWVRNPEYYATFAGVSKASDLAPLFYGALDKNWAALIVFLYWVYSVKTRKKLGICIGLGYPFAYLGRQYVMMLGFIVFAGVCMRIKKGRFETSIVQALRKPRILFCLFLLGGAFIAVLSYLWVTYVIPLGVVAYKTGLNDGSNAIRMSSIQYVLGLMIKDPAFFVRGFDSSIYTELGINPEETGLEVTYYVYGLYRLVQPHNEVINMLVKEGLVFTVAYYASVSNVLSGLIRSRMNATIIFSFLLGCLFLHQMFTCQTLILLVFVLASVGSFEADDGPTSMAL